MAFAARHESAGARVSWSRLDNWICMYTSSLLFRALSSLRFTCTVVVLHSPPAARARGRTALPPATRTRHKVEAQRRRAPERRLVVRIVRRAAVRVDDPGVLESGGGGDAELGGVEAGDFGLGLGLGLRRERRRGKGHSGRERVHGRGGERAARVARRAAREARNRQVCRDRGRGASRGSRATFLPEGAQAGLASAHSAQDSRVYTDPCAVRSARRPSRSDSYAEDSPTPGPPQPADSPPSSFWSPNATTAKSHMARRAAVIAVRALGRAQRYADGRGCEWCLFRKRPSLGRSARTAGLMALCEWVG